jgi:WD40 repeat protein/tRNA A-37 threonylcarbamoyl transferase component Bud32
VTPPAYERVKELVSEASELQGEERARYLDQACGEDAALRAEVEELLALGSADENPLQTGVAPVSSDQLAALVEATTAQAREDVPTHPERIGPFRLIRRLATGGMGAVYEASQDNPARRVALKVLRRELLSPDLLKRFQQEAQILGLLQHAGIAQIYEAGTVDTPEGPLPYFAMEFVDGRPLVAYADDERLDQPSRLGLLAKVCDAVQHAHERGVVHRDLKPDNVLVTPDGHPKVLDFGVARATDADIQAMTVVTEVGQIMGTLPYMSPEQVLGDPTAVNARSDVYSLGVMLYELLCGQRPHEFGRVSVPNAARIIREDTVTSLGSLDTRYKGDVEIIVGMALEKDVDRRYASAAELADDIRRHLSARPISAHAPSSFYQLKKFARRHRGLVTGVVVALVALTVGLGLALRFGMDEAEQRRTAEQAVYRTALAAAALQIDALHGDEVARVLDAIPEDQRGWEWEHLRSRTSRHLWEVPMLEDPDADPTPSRVNGTAVVFSQDGERVICPLDDRTLGVWDTASGTLRHRIALDAPVRQGALASGPGGVAVLLEDRRLVICDDREGLVTHSEVLPHRALALDWDPHGGRLAVSCLAEDADEWGHGAPGVLLVGMPGDLAAVTPSSTPPFRQLQWTAGGQALLANTVVEKSLSWRGGLVRLDARTWEQVGEPRILGPNDPFAASTEPVAGLVALPQELRDVRLLDSTGEELQERALLQGHREPEVIGLAVSRDGRLVASATVDGSVLVWDGRSGELLEAHDLEGVPQVALSPDGRWLAVSSGGTLRMLSPGLTSARTLEGPGSFVYDLAWTPDGRTLVARDFETDTMVYDALEDRALAPAMALPGGTSWWKSRTWGLTPDGTRAVALTGSGVHVGLDLASSGGLLAVPPDTPEGPSAETLRHGFPSALGLLGPGARAPSDSDPATARRDLTTPGYQLAPDGELGLDVRALQLLDARTGEPVRQLDDVHPLPQDAKATLTRAAFSPDGKRVAVTRGLDVVLVYGCARGELLAELAGHTSTAYGVAWSPDGARIATGSNDTTVRIWNGATYEPLVELRGHDSYVIDLSWSPDGRTLASGSGDGTVRLWGTRTVAERTALAAAEREQREAQRPWVMGLFEQHDDPKAVEAAVRAASDLDDEARHGALRAVRELANAWWAAHPVPAEGGEGGG